MNSDTPETDKMAFPDYAYEHGVVAADFARTLERRNRRLMEALQQATEQLEREYEPTPLDGNAALIRKLRAALPEQQEEKT